MDANHRVNRPPAPVLESARFSLRDPDRVGSGSSSGKLRVILIAGVALIALSLGGCATTDQDAYSNRPWNSPTGWEHGLPPQMLEGR